MNKENVISFLRKHFSLLIVLFLFLSYSIIFNDHFNKISNKALTVLFGYRQTGYVFYLQSNISGSSLRVAFANNNSDGVCNFNNYSQSLSEISDTLEILKDNISLLLKEFQQPGIMDCLANENTPSCKRKLDSISNLFLTYSTYLTEYHRIKFQYDDLCIKRFSNSNATSTQIDMAAITRSSLVNAFKQNVDDSNTVSDIFYFINLSVQNSLAEALDNNNFDENIDENLFLNKNVFNWIKQRGSVYANYVSNTSYVVLNNPHLFLFLMSDPSGIFSYQTTAQIYQTRVVKNFLNIPPAERKVSYSIEEQINRNEITINFLSDISKFISSLSSSMDFDSLGDTMQKFELSTAEPTSYECQENECEIDEVMYCAASLPPSDPEFSSEESSPPEEPESADRSQLACSERSKLESYNSEEFENVRDELNQTKILSESMAKTLSGKNDDIESENVDFLRKRYPNGGCFERIVYMTCDENDKSKINITFGSEFPIGENLNTQTSATEEIKKIKIKGGYNVEYHLYCFLEDCSQIKNLKFELGALLERLRNLTEYTIRAFINIYCWDKNLGDLNSTKCTKFIEKNKEQEQPIPGTEKIEIKYSVPGSTGSYNLRLNNSSYGR